MTSPFALNEFKQLSLSFDNGVLSLALNRPEKKNAIGVDMTLEIEKLLKQVAVSSAVKVLLIRGMHGNFSTGMDVAGNALAARTLAILRESPARSPSLRCFLTVLHAAEQVFLCSAARHPPAPVIKARITQVYPA